MAKKSAKHDKPWGNFSTVYDDRVVQIANWPKKCVQIVAIFDILILSAHYLG
jgi:hypothetical protein